jgi:peptidoglycan/xylan/chitin deacetylase (PgdA/CDA1 family)
MLHEFGLRGTFFVIAGLARPHKSDPPTVVPRLRFGEGALSWDEIRAIHNLGMEIGNHSLTHVFLNKITDEAELNQQINHAADLIQQNVGEAPLTFAFPYNEFSPQSVKVVLQRHIAFRDNWTDYGGPTFTTAFANALVDKAIRDHAWLVPMIHGINTGFLPLSSAVLRAHLAYIKSRADAGALWVDTYADVARYRLERQGAGLQVEDSVPGELTFSITDKQPLAKPVPLTVVLPLPLNENTADVSARQISSGASPGGAEGKPAAFTREKDCILVDVPPTGGTVRVRWH